MKRQTHGRLLVAAWLFCATMPAGAQAPSATTANVPVSNLGAIDEVVLYVHSGLRNTSFVEPLICALRRVLVAPVNVADIALPLGAELRATPTQFDVGKIAGRLASATAAEGAAHTFKYLVHPYDMKDSQFRYVFATSYGNATTPYHVGIVSMARIEVTDPKVARSERAQITAFRAYKLILKSVALLAGLPNSGGCILAFPRSLEELDQKSSEFCPADREALVAAKVLKAEESAGCIYVSERQLP